MAPVVVQLPIGLPPLSVPKSSHSHICFILQCDSSPVSVQLSPEFATYPHRHHGPPPEFSQECATQDASVLYAPDSQRTVAPGDILHVRSSKAHQSVAAPRTCHSSWSVRERPASDAVTAERTRPHNTTVKSMRFISHLIEVCRSLLSPSHAIGLNPTRMFPEGNP